MKDKIIYLVIGVLIGAILTTAIFFVFGNSIFKGSKPDGMPTGENGQMMEPPEGFDGQEPPAKPDENNKGNQSATNTNTEVKTNTSSNSNASI